MSADELPNDPAPPRLTDLRWARHTHPGLAVGTHRAGGDRVSVPAVAAIRAQCGAAAVSEGEPAMGLEDIAAFAERLLILRLRVGSRAPGRKGRLHSAGHRPNERRIGLGAQALSRIAPEPLR